MRVRWIIFFKSVFVCVCYAYLHGFYFFVFYLFFLKFFFLKNPNSIRNQLLDFRMDCSNVSKKKTFFKDKVISKVVWVLFFLFCFVNHFLFWFEGLWIWFLILLYFFSIKCLNSTQARSDQTDRTIIGGYQHWRFWDLHEDVRPTDHRFWSRGPRKLDWGCGLP